MDFPFVREAVTKLFSKPSCAMYPAVPSEAAPGYRGRIVFHPETCINCNMCERVCAGGAITHTEEKVEEGLKITRSFDLGSCTFCNTCADFCSRHSIEQVPEPRCIVTMGSCPQSGNVFKGSYSVCAPLSKYVHVDVDIAGCTPRPEAIMDGLVKATEILKEKRGQM